MLSTAQAREVLNYIKAVNGSISRLLSQNFRIAQSIEDKNIYETTVLSLPPYMVGTYDFFVATEDATAIQKVDRVRLVEFGFRRRAYEGRRK